MAKCDPYHTITEEEPKQRDVYHNYTECPDGRKILDKNRKDGTAGRPRCDACITLGS